MTDDNQHQTMSKILQPITPKAIDAIKVAYEQKPEDWRRDHLGASILGRKCERYIWLSFRWATPRKFDGRMLRLFERGKREEQWVCDDLRAAGVHVVDLDPETDQQWLVDLGGHVGGSMDAVVENLPESDGWHVLEIKTSNLKQFDKLVAGGVKRTKPEHWAQMQLYMHGTGIDKALYLCVCKNDDRMHSEIVPYDKKAATELLAKGHRLAVEGSPPERMDPAAPPCVYEIRDTGERFECDFYDLCHRNERPVKNCRTCIHVTPHADGSWLCGKTDKILSPEGQRAGCRMHLTIPKCVNSQIVDVDETSIVHQFDNGAVWTDRAALSDGVVS